MIVTSNMSDDEERSRFDEVDLVQPDMLTAWEKYQEFELCLYDEDDHNSRSQFIAEWKERMCSALAWGCQFSDSVLAFKLLEKSALEFDQVNAILCKLSPHDNTSVLSQTISKILKVCGEQDDANGKTKRKTKKTQNKRNSNSLTDDEDQKPAAVIKKRPKSKTEHKCHICLKSLSTPSYLRAHIALHDREPLKEHACPNCHARFRHEKGIQAHLKRSRCKALKEKSPDVEKEPSLVVEQSSVWLKGDGNGEDGGEEEMDNADDEHDVDEDNGDPNQHDYVQHPVKPEYGDVDDTTMDVKGSETIIASIDMKPGIEVHEIQHVDELKDGVLPSGVQVVEVVTANEHDHPEIQYQSVSVVDNVTEIVIQTTVETMDDHMLEEHLPPMDPKEEPKKEPGTRNYPRSKVECPICHKLHISQSQMRDHMVVHFDKRDFTCEICGAMFRRKRNLKRHVMSKTCSKRFNSNNDPLEVNKKFECEMCHKRFTHNFLLRVHMRTHTGERPYRCTFCTAAFATSKELFRHNRTHPEAIFYTCKECERDFVSIDTYKHHRVKFHGEKEEEVDVVGYFECGNCNMHFTSSSAYYEHRKLHGLLEPYQCDVCGKAFPHKRALRSHVIIHAKERPYKCSICGKGFCWSSALQAHIRTHTGEKPFECETCCRRFSVKKTLDVHMRVHTKERPHTCNICFKTFAQPFGLRRHMRMHTGEKRFACTVCNKTFTKRENLNVHAKSHKIKKEEEEANAAAVTLFDESQVMFATEVV